MNKEEVKSQMKCLSEAENAHPQVRQVADAILSLFKSVEKVEDNMIRMKSREEDLL